jgi:hypothetical protein
MNKNNRTWIALLALLSLLGVVWMVWSYSPVSQTPVSQTPVPQTPVPQTPVPQIPKAQTIATPCVPVPLTGKQEDFITTDGNQYKNVVVKRVEPDGIIVKSSSGILKIYFVELPGEVQERFCHDSEAAADYSRQQAANADIYNDQKEEIRRQQEENYARNWQANLQQQALNSNAQAEADERFSVRQNADLQAARELEVWRSLHEHHNPGHTTILHPLRQPR